MYASNSDYRLHFLGGLLLLWIFLVGLSFTLNMRAPFPYFYFFADESTYYTMTQSLAYDLDLTYSKVDLERVCQEWSGGPTGIFLKKSVTGTITFGKSFLYPLLAALPVRLFGTNGFLLLNSVSFALMITLGALYLRNNQEPLISFSFALVYFLFSAAWIFVFWIHPEIVVMTLVMVGYFVWFSEPDQSLFRWSIIALCFALATFAKITNCLLILPVLIDSLLGSKKYEEFSNKPASRALLNRVLPTLVLGGVFALVLGGFFLANKEITGDWNYQWGERKGFARQFPYEDELKTFESIGSPATREKLAIKLSPTLFLRNLFYLFFGRFGGLAVYFFPAFVVLLLFFRGEPCRKKYLLLGTVILYQLFFFVFLTDNFMGGMGTIGNRYFLNVYPTLLFLVTTRIPKRTLVVMVVVGSFFLAPMMVNPFANSFQPAEHTFFRPYKWLPIELTQIDFLPIHINHHLSRRSLDGPPRYRLTFMDYQTHLPERDGFWVKPGPSAEIILETQAKIEAMDLSIQNGPQQNVVIVTVNGSKRKLLVEGRTLQKISFTVKPKYVHNGWFIYILKFQAKTGFIPRFHDQESSDTRYLGCYVTLQLH